MRIKSFVKYGFAVVGVALLAGAAISYTNTNKFLETAVTTKGAVVDLLKIRSDDSYSFKPVIEFTAANGQQVEFTSLGSSNPPAYSVGESVEVLYSPSDVQSAKINSFSALWGGFLVMLILGVVFSCVAAVMFLVGKLRNRRKAYLQRNGVAVEAEFQSVSRNRSISVNGENPFVIVCQWLDPVSSAMHVFRSESLWFDPSSYIKDKTIRVFFERNNPMKFHVDVSFLPKLTR
ncbi:hypothetical protein ASE98_25350 [Pseudomonas sp. Leaf48]|uniref:DUF3592 domain-containing protein n=1 Tax=Pseudomonas sp. Leaf48 TaxID=1736221 RepID=UPI00072C3A39|nr:DUF3592 domain-containing protein [Pseudomonas sp. Leaf48]KQN47266.1 hypothetical protein ASE98_25350 [Pseudomonas sp. Leaf48]